MISRFIFPPLTKDKGEFSEVGKKSNVDDGLDSTKLLDQVKINAVFLVWELSKFDEGGSNYQSFHRFIIHYVTEIC